MDEIGSYYADIADASGLPVLVYNVPAFSGRSFGFEGLVNLLKIPGMAGIKHTSMNLYELERVRSRYPEKLILSGYDEVFLPALSAGADGMIGSTVNLMPEFFLGIRSAFQRGDMPAARAIQKKVNDVVESLASASSFFPALKYALSQVGLPCGECRRPFVPIDEKQKEAINRSLAEAGLIRKRAS